MEVVTIPLVSIPRGRGEFRGLGPFGDEVVGFLAGEVTDWSQAKIIQIPKTTNPN